MEIGGSASERCGVQPARGISSLQNAIRAGDETAAGKRRGGGRFRGRDSDCQAKRRIIFLAGRRNWRLALIRTLAGSDRNSHPPLESGLNHSGDVHSRLRPGPSSGLFVCLFVVLLPPLPPSQCAQRFFVSVCTDFPPVSGEVSQSPRPCRAPIRGERRRRARAGFFGFKT